MRIGDAWRTLLRRLSSAAERSLDDDRRSGRRRRADRTDPRRMAPSRAREARSFVEASELMSVVLLDRRSARQ
ncbi:hypothetical protein CQW49_15790 [Methylosinus trichosporium OB3b]|uniref:Uncharacterized protein n=1 Tax=Methylosinus trichosporium (strain ATCC 35070 / NCIMB 11131 / UNIQEM 75 / OB3b) TaxID=595536 RepID=A0A2D2D2U5_METT3|nr:hypothetical protein CQW49_15790 [Methylosinus trichosporium OB3b]OBS53602.1 hypothetical protein A8B73_05240 [Methylosinus sp. 3S-1]